MRATVSDQPVDEGPYPALLVECDGEYGQQSGAAVPLRPTPHLTAIHELLVCELLVSVEHGTAVRPKHLHDQYTGARVVGPSRRRRRPVAPLRAGIAISCSGTADSLVILPAV